MAVAQLPGSSTVRTGVLLGICKVDDVDHHIGFVGERRAGNGENSELAPTNPDRALERPAIVT